VKLFADVWLGFGFGVNPLLHDIESAANAILDYTTRDDRRVRVTGTANRDWRTSGLTNTGTAVRGAQLDIYSAAHHKQGARIVAGVDLKLRSGSSYSVQDHLGLKISDVPGTLWELTPFSWVVDYFVTVGPWLDDMFFTLPGVTKYVSLSRKYEVRTDLSGKFRYLPSVQFGGTVNPGYIDYFVFSRASLSSLPTRQIQVKSVDQVAQHGLTKLLNLASVLAGRRL
jgi:hypothetical protein